MSKKQAVNNLRDASGITQEAVNWLIGQPETTPAMAAHVQQLATQLWAAADLVEAKEFRES